jgi:hypothetical protein
MKHIGQYLEHHRTYIEVNESKHHTVHQQLPTYSGGRDSYKWFRVNINVIENLVYFFRSPLLRGVFKRN